MKNFYLQSEKKVELINAVADGDTDRLGELLESKDYVNLNEVNFVSGHSLLHHAAGMYRHKDRFKDRFKLAARILVKMLIWRGVDINGQSADGKTPLHHAREPEMIEVLVEEGANLNSQDLRGDTPLHEAAGREVSPEALKALVKADADVNKRGYFGYTPLYSVIESSARCEDEDDLNLKNTLEKAKALLDAGADPNMPDIDGYPPLHHLVAHSPFSLINQELAVALIKAGAEVNFVDIYGETPLHVAVKRGSASMVEALLDAGAKTDVRDRGGHTAFDFSKFIFASQKLEWTKAILRLKEASELPDTSEPALVSASP